MQKLYASWAIFVLCVVLCDPFVLRAADNEVINTLPNQNASFMTNARAFWQNELPDVLGRYFPSGWVYSGGIFTVGQTQGVSSPSFATEAFTSSGNRVTANSSGGAASIAFGAAVGCAASDTAWVIISAASGNTLSQFQRSGTSNYFVDCVSTTQPSLPTDSTWLMRITIASSAITAVRRLFRGNSIYNALYFIDLASLGWVSDDSTDNTSVLGQAETLLRNNGSADVGGVLIIPPGIGRISSWQPTLNGIVVRGAGHFASTIKCTDTAGAGDDCILLQNVSRHHWRDLTIDANSDKTSTLRFVAQVGNSNAEHVFTNVRFMGARTNTINFDDAGGGSPNDISQNTFFSCYVRSDAPANAQIRVNAANAVSNRFVGGQIGAPGAGSPFNIDLQTGQLTLFDTYLSGSTSYDINAASGQFQWYGGRTESTGSIFHSLSTDPSNDGRSAVHVIQGLQGSNGSATSVSHEARRVLRLDASFFNGNVRIGQAGGAGFNPATVIANAVTFAAGRGFVYEASTNGRMFTAYEDPSSTSIADTRARDAQFRTLGFQSIPTFSGGDTTPSVSAGMIFKTAANVGITMFDDGISGQRITVICDDGTTTITDGGNLFLAGAFSCTTNDTITFAFDGTNWYETARSVN